MDVIAFMFHLLLILKLTQHPALCSPACHLGTYLSIPEGPCTPCPHGTFMPQTDHTNTQCFQCTKIIDSTTEILITRCSAVTDTVIHCKPGFYRRLPKNPRETARCEPCSKCSPGRHEIEPCEGFHDVRCCDAENYVVAYDQGYPYCQERPWLCRKGEYFHQTSFKCVACPHDSYMNQDYHTNTECWKCQGLSEHDIPKNSIIVQNCNKTHPAIIECEKGFYINSTMGYSNSGTGCKQCTACDAQGMYLGRECTDTQDTVCCHHKDMDVVESPSGPVCQPEQQIMDSGVSSKEVEACEENHYLLIDNGDLTTARCEQCPYGSYLDASRHRYPDCKLCSEVKGQWIPRACLSQSPDRVKSAEYIVNECDEVYPILVLVCFCLILLIFTSIALLILFRVMRKQHQSLTQWQRENMDISENLLKNRHI